MDYSKVQWTDLVKDQYGNVIQAGTPISAGNMNRMEEGINLADNIIGVMASEALSKVGAINKELEKWQKQRLQQGIIYLYNKYVIDGCVISAMPNSRYLQIGFNGTHTSGNVSKVCVDGKYACISDEQMIAMVPMNADTTARIYYVYVGYSAGKYKALLSETVPDGNLILYRITVPAKDSAMDLSLVTITSIKRIEPINTMRGVEPYALAAIPGFPMLETNYGVDITIEGASDVMAVGEKTVYDKQANGFKIKITGSADNVQIRWTLINPTLK